MISSFFLLLYLAGILDAGDASILLVVSGLLFIIADFTLGLFFLVAFNGFIALVVASGLMTGGTNVFGLPLDWGFFFGIAVLEIALLVPFIMVLKKVNRQKSTTGTESMLGEKASVVSWDGIQGRVRIQGEIWNAQARRTVNLNEGDKVIIDEVDKLTLIIKPAE